MTLAQDEFPMETVVGVVADVRYRGIDDLRFDSYMPVTQTRDRVKHLMVRTNGDPTAVAASVRAAIADVAIARSLIESVTTMDRIAQDAVAPWRFSMTLLVGLAGIGAMLAAAGLFALVAYSVDQRSSELAVRLALGAGPGTILRMVLWQGGRPALAGLVAGVLIALAAAHRMSSLLLGVPARDLITFASALALLGSTALLASYLAARRVIKIDPLQAMRAQ